MAQKYLQIQLRLLYSVCYTMLEIIRRPPAPTDPEKWSEIHNSFKENLKQNPDYIVDLMDLMSEATQQTGQPILPLKKLALLVWKLTLAILGGFQDAHEMKNKMREKENLDPVPNPIEIIRQLSPVATQMDIMMGENFSDGQFVGDMSMVSDRRNPNRPRKSLEFICYL